MKLEKVWIVEKTTAREPHGPPYQARTMLWRKAYLSEESARAASRDAEQDWTDVRCYEVLVAE